MDTASNVIRFWGHKRFNCNCGSVNEHCSVCEGGLFSCEVCLGAEGSLPTHCPGKPMTLDEMDSVYNACLDYDARRGWVAEPAIHWRRRI